MALVAQSRPWTANYGREIADADGNVVQYTPQNLGQICLAINAYDRLIAALVAIDDWLGTPAEQRESDEEMRAAVKAAIGRIGCEQLAVIVEGLTETSPDVDRRIANELRVPEAPYTGSTDAAMTLVPKGWKYSVSDAERIDPSSGQTDEVKTVEVRSPDGIHTVTASNALFAAAMAAAALRAHDLSRA